MKVGRGAISALAALLIAATALTPERAAAAPQALSPWDAQLYSAAFDSIRRGDFADAEAKLAQVTDKCLVGLVEFQKLFHPKGYKASYQELTDWLDKYGDLSVAPRVWALAKKRKPEGAPDPTPPTVVAVQRTWASVDAAVFPGQGSIDPSSALGDTPFDLEPLGPKAAREAFNAGDMDGAIRIADGAGDRWVAGLAAFRKHNYEDAFRRFQQVALDVSEDPWVRAGGGYWAARSAIAKGSPEQAPELLRVAAQFPNTFYGQIAERQLGLTPAVRTGPVPYQAAAAPVVVKAAAGPDLDAPAMQRFIRSNPRAKRALALAQLGQRVDAGVELKAGLAEATDDEARRDWTTLALGVNAIFAARTDLQVVDTRDYPMPELQPRGGYTVDRALVYALVRKESRFDPRAISYAGAYGLMQLMPATAALVEGDSQYSKHPDVLLEPSTNLRVGQDYLAWLMNQGPIDGDILKTVAAYNGGPGPVFKTVKQLSTEADPLLVIESIPVPQSRAYVEEVMAAYWIYRRMLGEDTKSLDAVAGGARTVKASLDRTTVVFPSSAEIAAQLAPQSPQASASGAAPALYSRSAPAAPSSGPATP